MWVLAAIGNDGPAARHTLAGLIAIADRINPAVLTLRECTRAIGRLLCAGLVGAEAVADCYLLTEVRRKREARLAGTTDATAS